jgi:type IV pilus assembly protein PilA
MKTKFQLELLRAVRQHKSASQGFTLIELLIVVAIVGILAAIGIPRYLNVKNNADGGARVGELVGLAKECATFVASGGLGTVPTTGNTLDSPCITNGETTFLRTLGAGVSGLKCLDATPSVTTNTGVRITVSSVGLMTCSFT